MTERVWSAEMTDGISLHGKLIFLWCYLMF